MDGKNALVAVLAALVAILANAGLGRTTAAPPEATAAKAATGARSTDKPVDKAGPASPATPRSCAGRA